MRLKIILVVLLLISVFGVCPLAIAQTSQEAQRQALISQVQQGIFNLQALINQIYLMQQGGSWCYDFSNDLGGSNSGSTDVLNLHSALQREGISYIPDGIDVYGSGTSNAVYAFQVKYGIVPQTGYVGPVTRKKLNFLYSCGAARGQTCQPSWQCTGWSLCQNGQQTKSCVDSNSCGVYTGQPKMAQACKQQPAVKIMANNSPGPVSVFLSLGNGASVTSTGFIFDTKLNLGWAGVDVSSCSVSDALSPMIFSGYVPSNGQQTVTLHKEVKSSSTSSAKVTDTFKISCISNTTGSAVNGSVVVNFFYTVKGDCTPNWECTAWTNCANKQQTKTCIDWNGCGSLINEPLLKEACIPVPTVNIKANSSDGPVTVASGKTVSLSWTSTNATSCEASGDWLGTKAVSGTEKSSPITYTKIFILTCSNAAGSNIDSVTVIPSGGTQ